MMIEIIAKWLIPVVFSAVLGYISKQLKDNKKNNVATKSGMIAILRSQIVSKCENYIGQGYLPDHARYCLEDLFLQYIALGGNHGVGKLVDQCFSLSPIPLENK